jgi:hypothetical protein
MAKKEKARDAVAILQEASLISPQTFKLPVRLFRTSFRSAENHTNDLVNFILLLNILGSTPICSMSTLITL